MKQQLRYMSVAILSAGLFFTSCKKDKTSSTDDATELKVQSDDQSRFSNETDAIANDANAYIENFAGSYSGRPSATQSTSYSGRPLVPIFLPVACDATYAIDTTSAIKKITITYNGNICGGPRTRTGVVVVSFVAGFRWNTAGATYAVSYQNLKITRISDNKSITINGQKTVTNVTGGRLRNLTQVSPPIEHTVMSNGMSITFDDGSVRNWQVAKKRTFTFNNGIVISITGIAPQGGGIAEWGTNRFGNPFTSAITQALVLKQAAGFRLVSGQIKHTRLLATSTTTFGLDVTGAPVTNYVVGVLYYKIVWTGANGNSYTYIAPY